MTIGTSLTIGGSADIGTIGLSTYHDGRECNVAVRPDFTKSIDGLLLTNGVFGGDPRHTNYNWIKHWEDFSGFVALRWAEGGSGPLPVSKFPLKLVDSYSYAQQDAVGFSLNAQSGAINGTLYLAQAQ